MVVTLTELMIELNVQSSVNAMNLIFAIRHERFPERKILSIAGM